MPPGTVYHLFMATVVTVMDRPGWRTNTDNIVVVRPEIKKLLWVPRDLWCELLGDRINTAFARGGHGLLLESLAEHDLRVDFSLCLSRTAVEDFLSGIEVTIPIPRKMEYWYPEHPQANLQDGRKHICFEPPSETLRGERLHQWIGARRAFKGGGSDLHRIQRQKVLLRRLLEEGFSFHEILDRPDRFRWTGDEVLDDLARVGSGWKFDTLADVVPRTIEGKMVLVNRRSLPVVGWLRGLRWRRLA